MEAWLRTRPYAKPAATSSTHHSFLRKSRDPSVSNMKRYSLGCNKIGVTFRLKSNPRGSSKHMVMRYMLYIGSRYKTELHIHIVSSSWSLSVYHSRLLYCVFKPWASSCNPWTCLRTGRPCLPTPSKARPRFLWWDARRDSPAKASPWLLRIMRLLPWHQGRHSVNGKLKLASILEAMRPYH